MAVTNTPDKSEMKADARILPEAPHWNGAGKYGPALCMDNCTLHIMSRGFGAKDGDGYLTHNPNECEWDRDDESGKDYVVVPVSNSDLIFLRDKLNELFPSSRPPADQVPDMVGKVLREALAFVEEIERREDTHYLVGGHITDAIAALQAVPAASEVGESVTPYGNAGDALDWALDYLDDDYERTDFLERWREGDVSEWPEYASWLNAQCEGAREASGEE